MQLLLLCQETNNSSQRRTEQVNQVIVQPFQASDLDGPCSAGMKGMLLGFLVTMGAMVNGLDGGSKQGIKQRSHQTAKNQQEKKKNKRRLNKYQVKGRCTKYSQ
jgi:hypothetical protein